MPDAKSTPKRKRSNTVKFATMRDAYVAKRGGDSAKAKGLRAAIRSNRDALVKAGWKSLADHEKGAPYGDLPRVMANAIVKGGVSAAVKGD